MTRSQITVIVLVVIVCSVVLGLIAARVGGSAIRTSGEFTIGKLILSAGMIVPGTPVTVSYDRLSLWSINDASVVMMRTPRESVMVGEVTKDELAIGRFLVTVSCEMAETLGEYTEGRLVLVSNSNHSVLAQSESVTILPTGPECFYR